MVRKIKAQIHLSNRGHAGTPFCERLAMLIGRKVPYRWAEDIGIPKATFYGLWRDGAAPQKKTIDRIVATTGCSREWLVHGRGEPSLMLPRRTPAPTFPPPFYVYDELGAHVETDAIGAVVEEIEQCLDPKSPLSPRQKARLISVAHEIFLAIKPEDRFAKFPKLARAIVDLLLHHRDESND